jgi:predicted permease
MRGALRDRDGGALRDKVGPAVVPAMNDLLQDLRYAVRGFARDKGVTLAALLSLAIGIGANTSIFSVASALLLSPLPYQDAERLVILWNRSPGLDIAEDWFSTAQYFDIKEGHRGFEQLAIAIGANYNLTGDGEPERIGVIRVSSNLLPMLGARPALGQSFTPEDDAPGRTGKALLGHGTWARRYGRDPRVVGRSLTLNGQPYVVAGVLPEGFSLPREVLPTLGVVEDGEIFLPLPLGADARQVRSREDYNVIGKLARGVTLERAQAEMDAITARLRREFPDVYPPNGGLRFSIVPLLEQVVGNVRFPLLVLSGSVLLVLLIACANVANLMLSRALAREKEIAIRAAVGAGRGRIARQLLTESLLLALCGGALALVAAFLAVAGIHALRPDNVPRLRDIGVDLRVLGFTLLLCAFCGLLFGLVPALYARRVDVLGALTAAFRGSGAGSVWGRGNGLRRALCAFELALAVVLLIGAGLLVRSFARLQDTAPGFRADGVLTFQLMLGGRRHPDETAVRNGYRELWQRLERLPGVSAAGGVTSLPLSGYFAWGPISVDGRTPPPGEKFVNADMRAAGGRYFEAMGIPLLRGRLFEEQDTIDTQRVILVDEFMAALLWPGQDPIGKRVRLGDSKSTAPWRTVVGVVGRVKQYGLDSDPRIALYFPHMQSGSRALYVTVKAAGEPAALAAAIKREIHALDPELPIYRLRRMGQWVEQSLARQRFAMLLLSLFALLAFTLAAIGIYGVVSYLVGQGTREIGIRIALGATQASVLKLVMRQGLLVALAGAGAGLAVALALGRFLQSLLFGIRAYDPPTFAGVAAALLVVALLASYLPARRAARTDPMASLRAE